MQKEAKFLLKDTGLIPPYKYSQCISKYDFVSTKMIKLVFWWPCPDMITVLHISIITGIMVRSQRYSLSKR